MTVTDILHPVVYVASIAAVVWWIAGRWIGGERLVVTALAVGLTLTIGNAVIAAQNPLASITASLVAALAIYGAWRLKHFARENTNV